MKKILLFGLLGLMGLSGLRAQMMIDTWAFSTGVDTTLWMDLGSDYTTLMATTMGSSQNYGSSGLRDIGFPFTLGATTHTKFSTNVNGTVRLGNSAMPNSGYIAEPLGQNINAGPRIDAFGRAAMFDPDCYTRSAVLGDSGSRVLVVETRLRDYGNWGVPEGSERYVMFQVQLFEAGGLRIVYGEADSGAIYGDMQNGVAATGNVANKDVLFIDFASQRAVRFNGTCSLRNAVEDYPVRGRWYGLAPDPSVCPVPPAVTPVVTSAAAVLLPRTAGDSAAYRVVLPVIGLDTVWPAAQNSFALPPLNPATTYSLQLQTLCGGDTSYRMRSIEFFTGCGAVRHLPWSTPFNSLSYSDCWEMPYVSGNNADFTRRWRFGSGCISCPSAAGTYNSWLYAPVFYLPDTDGITLQWDYRALQQTEVNPVVELRVAPCAEDGTVASGTTWVTLMTLTDNYTTYKTFYANLDAWRGQRVRVAFVRTGEGGGTAYIDNVSLYRQEMPVFEWEVPTMVLTGDTAQMTAAWLAGVDSNVMWSWHSALMDTTMVIAGGSASMVSLVYTVAGWDTVTLTVSNVYGSDSAQAVVDVLNCGTIATFPWIDDFTHSSDCWSIDGWTIQGSVTAYDADGLSRNCNNVYYANNTGKYMLMQPVAVPATGAEHLSLWVEADGPLMVRVSPTGVLDTAAYTDTLLIVPDVSNRKEIWWRTASLSAYAGQTVRVGLFKMDGTQAFVSAVKIDFDTLPVLGTVSVASRSRTDSTNVCRAELRYGAIDGLTFTWHSTLVDTTIVTTGSTASIAPIAYTVGGWDTITVVMSNAYGADTAVRVVQVMDCHPVHALPWREEFDDGLDCWYLTQNDTYHQWQRSYRFSLVNNIYQQDFYAASQCNFSTSSTTPADAWMVSRAITLPADTALAVRLFWEVAISSGNNLTNNYRVMVSTAADCTDTTLFEELYHDTLPLPYQTGFAQRSVSLAAYAGQTVFIAFRNQPLVRRATALMIDKVEVRATVLPRLELAANNDVFYYGDTAIFVATLMEGSDSGLVYTWHSNLLDSTWTTNGANTQCSLTYGLVDGTDTVTIVATNAYGSDTASVEVTSTIINEPTVYLVVEGRQFNKVETDDTVVYCATRNRCVTTGMTYLFHSSLMDTTVTVATTADTVRVPMVYSVAGIDTFTVTLSNIYDTSLTVPVYMTVLDCPPVSVPYMEDFESMTISYVPDCWDGRFWVEPNNDGRGAYFFDMSHDAMLISPLIDLPADSLGLQLSWGSEYTFYINADVPSKVFVSPTGGKRDEDFTDTLYTGALCQRYGTGSDSVLLDAYRGSQVRIAFPSIPNTICLYDNIRVDYNRTAPQVSLDMPGTITLHDTVLFTATFNACSPQGLSVSWHSTLMGTSLTPNPSSSGVESEVQLVYAVTGVDTITVIVANAYGADTAVAVVTVIDCAMAVPFFEDFNSIPGTSTSLRDPGFLPPCWSAVWDGDTAAYEPHVYSSEGYGFISNRIDNAVIMLGGSSSGFAPQAGLVLPRIDDSLHHLMIAFDYNFENVNHGILVVGYYDDTVFTAVDTLAAHSGNYRRDTVSFALHTFADNPRIAIRWQCSDTYYGVAIDNIEVYNDSTAHLRLQVALDGPTVVDISDTAIYTATLLQGDTTGLTYTWHSSMLDSTMVTIAPMVPIVYTTVGIDTLTVIASNAYGADTAMVTVSVYNCNDNVLPYVEDFEGVTPVAWNNTGTNALPTCWEYSYNGTTASIHLPSVVSSYQYISNMPDNALLMMAGNTSGYATWVQAELPLFNVPLSSLVLALDYCYESATAGILTVGYVDDTLGFFPVKTLTPHVGGYTRDTVYLAGNVAGYNGRIALRFAYNTSFYGVVVDNIEVFISNGILAPDMLTVENVTATCATLRWSEVDTATAYRVTIRGAMSIDTVVTDTTLTLCGLVDDADYGVMVVPMVGSDAGRSVSATFHTLMLCAPLANVSISTTGTISWQYDTVTGEEIPVGVVIEVIDQLSQAVVHIDTAYTSPYVPDGLSSGRTYSFAVRTLCPSGTANTADTVELHVAPSVCAEAASNTIPSNSHFMDNFHESNYSQVIYPASFAAGIDTLYGIALRVAQYEPYSWQTTSGTCRYDIYVGQTNGTHTSPLTSDSLTMVVQNKHYSLSGTGWKDFVFNTPYIYDGTGSLVVTIVSRQSNTTYSPVYGVHTDATCTHFVQDANHDSGNINPSTFNFNWEVNTYIPDIRLLGGCGGSTNTCLAPETEVVAVDTHSVSLQWAQRGSESLWQVEYRPISTDAWQVADTTSAISFTITGLAQATHYVVRVGAVCSDSLVVYGFPDSATTLCGYMELPYTISFLADEYPCWTLGSSLYYSNWNGVTLSEWNTNGYLISPEVNTNIADLRATITSIRPIAESYESRFAVGVGNADGSNVTWIDTIGFLQQYTLQTDEVHFNHYTGSGRHIILRGVEGTCNIHQFTLEAFAGCVPVHDVTVDIIGEHSAHLTWMPEVATNTWAVYLDGALVATTSTPSYTLSGLNSNTQYSVAVREICGAGDTSTAVTRLFQTRCDAFALPYFEEFDQAPAIGNDHILTDCWIFHKDGRYASAYYIGDQWSYTCLMFYDDAYSDTHAVNYVCSPRLQVGYGGATVRFKGQTSFDGIFTVGIMPDPYDTTTFIPVRDITVSSGGMAWYSFSTDTVAGAPVGSTLSVAFRFVGEHGHGTIDSLFVEDIPVTTYDLAIGVNDTTMGTVSGAGTYVEGTTVTVTATPNPGYRFVVWSDSVTSATRQITLRDNDISLTAYFEPVPQYTVAVNAVMNDGSQYDGLDEMVHGAGTYADGDTVTLEGEVHGCGISLEYWIFAGNDTVYDNPYSFTVNEDVEITAVFALYGGIGDVEGNDFRLYPNPASTTVTVEADRPATVTLLDVSGRESGKWRVGSGKTPLDISGLPRGVYFVRFDGSGAVKKLIVK